MIRWQPDPVHPLTKNAIRRVVILALASLGLTALALGATSRFRPVIVYNASASVPLGYYRVLPVGKLTVTDLVLLHTPESVRDLADRRGYLPRSVPMIKSVAALEGDEVCAVGNELFINGHLVARRRTYDHHNRSMPRWEGCQVVADDEVFVLNGGVRDSFDGRYFGIVKTSLIIGRLAPL
ncbi:S26 family signal peptidase [Asticcacaulis sp. SL142]|uniref:S26 family signal peptidase n=1 Tax=Asticcacaulis sp. SL142 TaxID=2995155 RepID=UPI00226D0925|nr:S26 family signal peptidase [Asticcacaulis sp. SL142]WAC49768.1 S26 family signal peptidase [Asticcacaulis sp. SL142]